MAKEPASRKKSGASGKSASRGELERLDRELLKLFNQRARVARDLMKQQPADVENAAVDDTDTYLTRLVEQNRGPLSGGCVRGVFRELISGANALRQTTRVAFLGPAYSYSHVAALTRFGSSVEQVPVASIAAVFEEVNRGHAEFGLVPVENSTDGRVADTLDMFTRLRVRICGEVLLPIHHCLLGRCARSEILEVYSKVQPLSQCRNWLARHLPSARIVEVTSTSTAAQLAQDKPGAAAIASRQAGIHYGLDLLAENIEDNQDNVTRFAVIGESSAPRTGQDRMSLMFEVEHKPGALADAMNVFKRAELNLTWIESFPIARPQGGYMFFVELDGHEADARIRKALAVLERKTLRLEVLGSYARGAQVE